MNISPDKKSGASAPRPTVRHNRARAELGECYCPKCAPELHVQPAAEETPPLVPAVQETPTQAPEPPSKRLADKSFALDGAERIAIGGTPRPNEELAEQLRAQLRAEEARWLVTYGALHEAITTCRAQERAIASLQQELRATVEGVYREKMLANEIPRLWIDRTRWAAIVEAQRCAIALVSKMASAGPDWTDAVATERAALTVALAALDALVTAESAALSPASAAASSTGPTNVQAGGIRGSSTAEEKR